MSTFHTRGLLVYKEQVKIQESRCSPSPAGTLRGSPTVASWDLQSGAQGKGVAPSA